MLSLIIFLCLLSRSAIQWAKMDQLIPSGGKKKNRKRNIAGGINAFVTRKGSLRIPGIGYQDAGIYSCMGMTILLIFKKFVQLLITKMTLSSDLFSQTFSMRKCSQRMIKKNYNGRKYTTNKKSTILVQSSSDLVKMVTLGVGKGGKILAKLE